MNEQTLFDTCWQALAAGESLEAILERHPDQRQELEPMLLAAGQLQAVRAVVAPTAFRQNARARLREQMSVVEQETSAPYAQRLTVWWHDLWASSARPLAAPAWAGAALALVFVLLTVTTTTYAAQAALPGDTLYPVKLASEQVWYPFATDSLAFDMTLAERRLQEARSLQAQNRHEAVPDALIHYQQSLDEWSERIEMAGMQDQDRVQQRLQLQLQELQEIGQFAPAEQQAMLQEQQREMERLMHRFGAPLVPTPQRQPARTPGPARMQQTPSGAGRQDGPGQGDSTQGGHKGTPQRQATPVPPTKMKPARTPVPGQGNQGAPQPTHAPASSSPTPEPDNKNQHTPQHTPTSDTDPGTSHRTPAATEETPTPAPSPTPETSPTAGPGPTMTPGNGGHGGGTQQPTVTPGSGGQPDGGGGSHPTATPGSGGKK